jgi:hypothetical protein
MVVIAVFFISLKNHSYIKTEICKIILKQIWYPDRVEYTAYQTTKHKTATDSNIKIWSTQPHSFLNNIALLLKLYLRHP